MLAFDTVPGRKSHVLLNECLLRILRVEQTERAGQAESRNHFYLAVSIHKR